MLGDCVPAVVDDVHIGAFLVIVARLNDTSRQAIC